MRFFIVLFLLFSLTLTAAAEQTVEYTAAKKNCLSGTGAYPWTACIYTPTAGGVNGNIAYYLHGRNLNANTWNDDTFYTAMIQQYWKEHKLVPPTVVSISFGPVWLLTPKGKLPSSGLTDVVTSEIIPAIEKNIGLPSRRILFGESMGGLNSLVLGLTKTELFQKVAALCPAIYKNSPFSEENEILKFIERTGADPKTVDGIIALSKNFFADETEWNQSSPLRLIQSIDPKNSPQIYLSCGLYDPYGNFEGSQIFAKTALNRKIDISWHPMYGGHCAIDIPSLAEFLVH